MAQHSGIGDETEKRIKKLSSQVLAKSRAAVRVLAELYHFLPLSSDVQLSQVVNERNVLTSQVRQFTAETMW